MGSQDQDNTSASMPTPPVPDKDTSANELEVETDHTQKGRTMGTSSNDQEVAPEDGYILPGSEDDVPDSSENPEAQAEEVQVDELELNDKGDTPSGASVFVNETPVPDAPSAPAAPEDGYILPKPTSDDQPPAPPDNNQANGEEADDSDAGGDGNQPPPFPLDTSDDREPRWYRKHRTGLLVTLVILIFAALAFTLWQRAGSDDSDDSSEPSVTGVVDETLTLCQEPSAVNLEQIGVLRFGDSLHYNTINPFWMSDRTANGDAEAILANAVDELYQTVLDGCSPAGVAYWRYVMPHVIDAERPGIDNNDATTRITAYTKETDTRVAVAEETASQLSNCADVQFVQLTVEEAPRIYVAAYAQDYSDVVFVQTPLLQLDDLSNGDRGLIVIRCSFGKMEGTAGSYVNETFISPSLRAIVYRDQPAGVQVFQVTPETEDSDKQTQDPREREEELNEPDDPVKEPDTESDPVKEPDTESDPVKEPDTESDPVKEPDTESDPVKEPDTESDPVKEPDTESDPVKEPDTESDPVKEPDTESDPVKEPDTESDPVKEPDTESDPVITPEDSSEGTVNDDGQDAGQTDNQTDEQKPTDGSGDGCDGTCGQSDTDGDTGDGDSSDGNQGGDTDGCNTDCPGDDAGDQGTDDDGCTSGNCPGDDAGDQGDDNGDGCTSGNCPGDDDDGDNGCGDDCPDDGGGDPEPACLPGEILDPSGNCKSPDPGVGSEEGGFDF